MTHKFTPTPEQVAVVTAGSSTSSNLLVSALAGAAKTSTLVLLAEALEGENILCLAFNKKIAEEMRERLPAWCTSQTLSSVGYRAWGAFLRKRLTLDKGKTTGLVKKWIAENLRGEDEIEDFWEVWDDTRSAITGAKTCGYVPSSCSLASFESLMTDEEFDEWLDVTLEDWQIDCVTWVLNETLRLGMQGLVDFDDMIYLPTLCKPCTFPFFPCVLVDEAQDLSSLNHAMLWKMTRKGKSRVIAVGDACQSIYGFRGAHQDSMELLKRQFEMQELHLTISFRCPRTVVEGAQWRAPSMRYPEWAIEGEVSRLPSWSEASIPERAAIICRNNAPLLRTAIRLLKRGRYPEIVGNNITERLDKIYKKFGSNAMPIDEVIAAIEIWTQREKEKRKDHGAVDDMRECLLIFTAEAENLGAARMRLEDVMRQAGPIKLMTGHKSKGLEFPHVFILDQWLVKTKEHQQERNLLYVMQTRAQETLTYINSDDWEEEEQVDE